LLEGLLVYPTNAFGTSTVSPSVKPGGLYREEFCGAVMREDVG